MNQKTFPKLITKTEADGETALTPIGWDQRFYKIAPEPFRFTKRSLSISDDVFIEDNFLEAGTIRVDGFLEKGRLQICFVESEQYRVLGYSSNGQLQTISYDGSHWDITGVAPGRATTFNADRSLVAKIVPEGAGEILRKKMTNGQSREALVLPMTSQSSLLLKFVRQCFYLTKYVDMDKIDSIQLQWMREDIVEMASSLIDEITQVDGLMKTQGETQRRAIARDIENALWNPPVNEEKDTSLDEFAIRLGCSRRSIQQAITENFGVGFTEFKRSIRLHQARQAIEASPQKPLGDISAEHDFLHHGRFVAYYKEFFGVSPKETRKPPSR